MIANTGQLFIIIIIIILIEKEILLKVGEKIQRRGEEIFKWKEEN